MSGARIWLRSGRFVDVDVPFDKVRRALKDEPLAVWVYLDENRGIVRADAIETVVPR